MSESRDYNYEEFDAQDPDDVQDSFLSGGPDDDEIDAWENNVWNTQGSFKDDEDEPVGER